MWQTMMPEFLMPGSGEDEQIEPFDVGKILNEMRGAINRTFEEEKVSSATELSRRSFDRLCKKLNSWYFLLWLDDLSKRDDGLRNERETQHIAGILRLEENENVTPHFRHHMWSGLVRRMHLAIEGIGPFITPANAVKKYREILKRRQERRSGNTPKEEDVEKSKKLYGDGVAAIIVDRDFWWCIENLVSKVAGETNASPIIVSQSRYSLDVMRNVYPQKLSAALGEETSKFGKNPGLWHLPAVFERLGQENLVIFFVPSDLKTSQKHLQEKIQEIKHELRAELGSRAASLMGMPFGYMMEYFDPMRIMRSIVIDEFNTEGIPPYYCRALENVSIAGVFGHVFHAPDPDEFPKHIAALLSGQDILKVQGVIKQVSKEDEQIALQASRVGSLLRNIGKLGRPWTPPFQRIETMGNSSPVIL